MRVNFLTIIISAIVALAIISLVIGQAKWGILAGLIIAIGGAKWLRLKRQEQKDDIEYDERVNHNIKLYSVQSFSIANLLLLVYLIISNLVFQVQFVRINDLIIYLSITFVVVFYIVPWFSKRK